MERPIGEIQFGVALFLASVFKILAVLTLIGGLIVTFTGASGLNNTAQDTGIHQDVGVFVGASLAGTIVTSAFFAFFGYVLEILVEIYEQVWHVRYGEDDDDEDDDDGDEDEA